MRKCMNNVKEVTNNVRNGTKNVKKYRKYEIR